MVDPEFDEEVIDDDDDDWDDDVKWLMAPMTPSRATVTVSSTYEVGCPSTTAVEGPSSPFPELPMPPTVIEDLSTRLGNLEYRHGVLMRKMEEVSDAEVADSIAIGEIHPRVATVEERVESRVDTYPSGQMAVPGQDVIIGLSQQVQTLQTTLHEAEFRNQEFLTKVAEIESHEGEESVNHGTQIPMQVSLLLLTAWRESHASHYDRVVPKQKYLWYCSERASLERSDERKDWRFQPSGDIRLHPAENNPSSQRLNSNGIDVEVCVIISA
nr:hypothetical protein [Tanacetum cinerariifolium]